jgi:hypothetical protein
MCHAPHFAGNLLDLWDDIYGECRNAGVKRTGGVLQMTCVSVFICDIRMWPKATGAIEIGFRGIHPNHVGSVLSQGERQSAGAAAYIKRSVVGTDAGKFQERLRKTLTPSPMKCS